ncbi:MAG: ferrochelatase [candidate division Zixibacteria bacterium]|nr:ferrochelatase [candidate division Zixibacteria bacterium]
MADSSGRAILLVNLGSPDEPTVPAVRRYLRQFLMDGRVLDVPWPLRKFIVEALILPRRPQKTAAAYQSIWTPEGSPLVAISRRVRDKLAQQIGVPLGLGMSYGEPSIRSALEDSQNGGEPTRELLLIPMYPHYAMSTYETTVVAVREAIRRWAPKMQLTVLPPFYDDSAYITALTESASEWLKRPYDHLLFSYHGLPERHLRKTDPTGNHCLSRTDCCRVPSAAQSTCYRAQVLRATEAFVRQAGVPEGKYSIAFQSRLGRDRWLGPDTEHELVGLAQNGVRNLAVICPSFVADCLETLEEIGLDGRDAFLAAGGREFHLIPCLNDHPAWIAALAGWCRRPW